MLQVEGHGSVAELVRSLLAFNYSARLDDELSNRACLEPPRSPDWTQIAIHVGGPLAGMLVLQVIFGFVVRRVTIFCVLGFVLRRRAKTRIVQLYNRVLVERMQVSRQQWSIDS